MKDDDDLLMANAAAGDAGAFRKLMERRTPAVLALALRTIGDRQIAQEIVQDCFLKAWINAPKWRPGAALFSTWLYRVVLNACLDHRRRPQSAALDSIDEIADSGPDGFDHSLARRRRALVLAALDQIPERQKAALCLHYFSDLSAPEAAAVLEISLGAAESLLVRGKRSLRRELAQYGVTGMGDVF